MNTIEVTKEKHNKDDFARLRSVLACASHDPTRHVINKVKVERDKDGIAIIATDGRRLRMDRFGIEAKPGLYDIRANTARSVFLSECTEDLAYPDYTQAIPSSGKRNAYSLEGTGRKFVLWASAALGCYVDPRLVEVGDDEPLTLVVQKDAPHLSPVLLKSTKTTMVVMPVNVDGPWARELEAIRQDLFGRRGKGRKAA